MSNDSKVPWFSLPNNVYLSAFLLLSFGWWAIAGAGDQMRAILLAAASLAAFVFGGMAGFLFSSFGEELSTFGKIRDWVIAGITGATFAELAEQGGSIKKLLSLFAVSSDRRELALVVSMAVLYFGAGFFVIFLQRELLINLLLAKSRAERGRLDGTVQAGFAIQKLLSTLPPSLLTGTDSIDGVIDSKEVAEVRSLLTSDDVNTFLKEAEETARNNSMRLDWDATSKAAYIYYYKVYCAPEGEKPSFVYLALQWIRRALILNPMHVDLTMKYGDLLCVDKQYEASASILEQMKLRTDAPAYLKQWLGYVLLWLPNRQKAAIDYALEFMREFPDKSDGLFNIACAYAQLYCKELKTAGMTDNPLSENRKQALHYLEEGLTKQSSYKKEVYEKYSSPGGDFECMKSDPEYKKLVDLKPAELAATGATKR